MLLKSDQERMSTFSHIHVFSACLPSVLKVVTFILSFCILYRLALSISLGSLFVNGIECNVGRVGELAVNMNPPPLVFILSLI
jgi:hypothetical protein